MTAASAPTKTRNVTGREHCAACIDGWVELRGTITTGHVTYERGRTACRWCEQGVARFERHHGLESNYGGGDITPPEPPVSRPAKPTAAQRAAIAALVGRARQPDTLGESEAGEIATKVETARIALHEPEPASQEPLSDVGDAAQVSQHGGPGAVSADDDGLPY